MRLSNNLKTILGTQQLFHPPFPVPAATSLHGTPRIAPLTFPPDTHKRKRGLAKQMELIAPHFPPLIPSHWDSQLNNSSTFMDHHGKS